MGPQVSKTDVPSYETVEEEIKNMDGTVIVLRIFYLPDSASYRFQLIRKNRMCLVEIQKKVLDHLKDKETPSIEELRAILKRYLDDADSWSMI